MEDIQGKYEKLLNEYNTLRIENEELKSIPQQHGIAYPREDLFSNKTFPTVKLFRSEKITLFRSYFKGRLPHGRPGRHFDAAFRCPFPHFQAHGRSYGRRRKIRTAPQGPP